MILGMTYKTREEAVKACRDYSRKVSELQDQFGTWETTDDSCVSTYIHARFRDENGKESTITFDEGYIY